MDKKQLTIICAETVVESKLPKEAKLQMLNFIKEEASEVQLKALLLDGKIIPQVDVVTEQIINDRFNVSEAGGRIATLRKSFMTQAGAGGGLNPYWLIYRTARSMFDKCTKRCGAYEINTARRQVCMAKCKVDLAKQELAAAQKVKDEKKINKAKIKLDKALKLLQRYQQSFQKRDVDLKTN